MPASLSDPPGTGLPTQHRSYLVMLLGGGGFIIMVIVLMIGAAITQGQVEAYHTAEVAATNLSKIVADDFVGIIGRVDLGILSILDEVSEQNKASHWDDRAIFATIARQDARLPDVHGFRIFGPDGKLRYAISNVADRHPDLSEREDFKYLRDNKGGGLMVG
ncbi:MAG: hypothetical protein HQL37_16400, partial [Alphaproteobacteria bacterium]|nr:hypothetical protein [Alphaproteobacteria bacterium]